MRHSTTPLESVDMSPGGTLGACISILRVRNTPLVTVVVLAYRRPERLAELVDRLRSQNYPYFEVIILEQSENAHVIERIRTLNDSRLRVIPAEPMDTAAARNTAMRYARGEIFLLIADDDLPLTIDWISRHVTNYQNPNCMGVVGRFVADPDRLQGPLFPRFVRAFCMRRTVFRDVRVHANNTLRKEGIDFLLSSNTSVRRSLVERIGGWDEGIPTNEAQSFAIKFAQMRKMDEHLVFDPGPLMWKRIDAALGVDGPIDDTWYLRELEAQLFYYRHVVGHYFRWRYRLYYLLVWPRATFRVLEGIWSSHSCRGGLLRRLAASIDLLIRGPTVLRHSRFSKNDVRRIWHLI